MPYARANAHVVYKTYQHASKTRATHAKQHNRRPDMLLCRCLMQGRIAEFKIPRTGQILSRGKCTPRTRSRALSGVCASDRADV